MTHTIDPARDAEIQAFHRLIALEKPPAEQAGATQAEYVTYLTTILGFDDCGHDINGDSVTWEPVIVTRGRDCRGELVERLVAAVVALNCGLSSDHRDVAAGELNYSVSVVCRPRGAA